jgi:dipeptidase E
MPLTSAGARNETLKSALVGLVGRPLSAAVIPTTAIAGAGDHGWLVENLSRLHGLGWHCCWSRRSTSASAPGR